MIIGFTGSQSGMTDWQQAEVAKLLKLKECSEFVHGDCIGSDVQANWIALQCGVKIFTIFPPHNAKKRAFCFDDGKLTRYNREIFGYKDVKGIQVRWYPIEDYLKRNEKIVNNTALLIAAPKEHKHTIRSGTWATIRYAWKNKKDIIIIPPIERPDDSFYDQPQI